MRLLCLADIHRDLDGNDEFQGNLQEGLDRIADNIVNIIKKEKIDVFIYAGDFHTQEYAQRLMSRIRVKSFIVEGNWEPLTFDEGRLRIKSRNASVIHWGVEEYKGYHFFCVGNFFSLSFDKLALLRTKNIDPKKLIFITHYPPKNIFDRLWSGHHVGYPEYNRFLDKKKPLLHVFGHIHEDVGHKVYKKTLCINCAAARTRKGYIIDLPSRKIRAVRLD